MACVMRGVWRVACGVWRGLQGFFIKRFKMFASRFGKHRPRIKQAQLWQRILRWIFGILPLQVDEDAALGSAIHPGPFVLLPFIEVEEFSVAMLQVVVPVTFVPGGAVRDAPLLGCHVNMHADRSE